jgi:sugar phosphate isomerase/epimerase
MLREIRDLGFEYAELSHGIRVSLVPGIIDAVEAGVIKISTLHNFCPLPMGVNHAAPNLFKFSASEKRERDLAWKHSIKTIETAERLGAKLIVLHSGAVDLSGFFGDPHYQDKLEALAAAGKQDSPKYTKLVAELEQRRESRKEQPMELALDMIRRLAEVAGEKNLMLGIENRESVEEIPFDHDMLFFLDQLPDNVRYWHDCGHAQIKHQMGFIDHRMHLESLSERLGGLHTRKARRKTFQTGGAVCAALTQSGFKVLAFKRQQTAARDHAKHDRADHGAIRLRHRSKVPHMRFFRELLNHLRQLCAV